MSLGAVKGNAFWVGTGAILVLLFAVGGWEIWASLSEASDSARKFSDSNRKIETRSRAPIPADREIQYWKDLQADYEKDWEEIRARLAKEEDEFEDIYFLNALTASYRVKGATLPAGLDVEVARATEHWFVRNGQHQIPRGAFEERGFEAAFSTAVANLEKKARMQPGTLKLPNIKDQQDVSLAILNAQKTYWAAYRFVTLLLEMEKAEPDARLRIESIDFTQGTAVGPKPAIPAGKQSVSDVVRETPFYRTVPFSASVTLEFASVPDLLRRVLNPEPGKQIGAFRFRDKLNVEYNVRGSGGGGDDALGGGTPGFGPGMGGGRRALPQQQSKSASGGQGSRVKVAMDLEMWDWEVRPLAEYRDPAQN